MYDTWTDADWYIATEVLAVEIMDWLAKLTEFEKWLVDNGRKDND